jgi:hypothetical protein
VYVDNYPVVVAHGHALLEVDDLLPTPAPDDAPASGVSTVSSVARVTPQPRWNAASHSAEVSAPRTVSATRTSSDIERSLVPRTPSIAPPTRACRPSRRQSHPRHQPATRPQPSTPPRTCHLRHRPQTRPVAYAADPNRPCRWRRRQAAVPVAGVADSRRPPLKRSSPTSGTTPAARGGASARRERGKRDQPPVPAVSTLTESRLTDDEAHPVDL